MSRLTAWITGSLVVALAIACLLGLLPRAAAAASGVLGEGVRVEAVEIDASPAEVWNVLTDFDAWVEIFPHVQRVQVERMSAERVDVRQRTEAFGWVVEYTSRSTLSPAEGRIAVELDRTRPHDIEELTGVWEVTPNTYGTGTVLELRLRIVSGLPIPGFLERRFVGRSVKKTVAAVAAEVERRASSLRSTRSVSSGAHGSGPKPLSPPTFGRAPGSVSTFAASGEGAHR
jgi:ribosome-associated toxin RatA of RatAB toxin-antitoxin module